MSWEQLVVEELCRWKAARAADGRRYDYEHAWRMAVMKHRPSLRDRRVSMTDEQMAFDGPVGELSLVEFFHEACSDAWHGRRPKLEGLAAALEGGLSFDEGKTASHRTVGGRNRAKVAA
jgi:hypothetical protein